MLNPAGSSTTFIDTYKADFNYEQCVWFHYWRNECIDNIFPYFKQKAKWTHFAELAVNNVSTCIDLYQLCFRFDNLSKILISMLKLLSCLLS